MLKLGIVLKCSEGIVLLERHEDGAYRASLMDEGKWDAKCLTIVLIESEKAGLSARMAILEKIPVEEPLAHLSRKDIFAVLKLAILFSDLESAHLPGGEG